MMKHLILMRHGKAEKDAPSGEDFERDLAVRGVDEAKVVARALKAYGIKPDFALVSEAHRTRQTFEAVKSEFGDMAVDVREDMYNADSNALRAVIEAHEAAGECILVIAHNPGIQYLALEYMFEAASAAPDRDRVRNGYATATATLFTVDVAGRPTFDGLYRVKDLLNAEGE